LKSLITTLPVLILFLLHSPVLRAQDRVSNLLSEVDVLVSENQYPEALEKTREALQVDPFNTMTWQKQISIYVLMDDEKEAMRCTEEAIERFPEIPEFFYQRGVINNTREKYSKALDDFDKAISLPATDNTYKFFLGRGVSHLNLMEYEQAIADFSRSIELNDTAASAYHSRAMAGYELRDYAAAVDDFLKALEFSEGNSALYFNLGMAYFRLNEKEKSCPYLHKSCTMGNNNACRMVLMECAKAIP
jgi:tetratricopeptide (TPR) repeat protein